MAVKWITTGDPNFNDSTGDLWRFAKARALGGNEGLLCRIQDECDVETLTKSTRIPADFHQDCLADALCDTVESFCLCQDAAGNFNYCVEE